VTETAVDAAAILGFDPYAPAFRANPYAHYRRLGALERTPAGLWVTTSHEICTSLLRDPRYGHRPDDGEMRRGQSRNRSFLMLDPPDHTRLRRLVSRAFTPRLIERLRPRIAQVVDELLANAGGDLDLIETLAYPLPVLTISELLGVPAEDHERFKGWSDALARGLDPDFLIPKGELAARDQARSEFTEYFRELLGERRRKPADDLLSALVAVRDEDGDLLSEAELLATCILLLVAGHETTVNLIGNGALALLRNPDQWDWFREHPEAAPGVVEELLRHDAPVQLTLRAALEDTDRLRKGEMVVLLTGAANRDPAAYPDPDRLDLQRVGPAPHLAFGHGIHFCLGAPMARLEGQIALTALARRKVSLRDEPLDYRDNLVLRGLKTLPVTLV
jgi:unspecific monooxygenase